MSKEACQKEIICMKVAIKKLDAIAEQIEFLCDISELNYRAGVDVDLKQIEANTKRIEKVIKQASKIIETLS